MEKSVFSVSELNNFLKQYFDLNPVLSKICVMGEISNYKLYPSGHHYFTLKDAEGSLSCVMFRSAASSLRFRPQNGMKVLASGRVSVYERDGRYQLYCSSIMPAGAGDLNLAFEQLKAKLQAEGLFDASGKQPLPLYPERIAVITSPVGAAVRDMIRILGARWPLAKVCIVPARVQGEEAPGDLIRALRFVNRTRCADVILLGRGGGSLEDLWCFNSELLARAIAASEIPVISCVGHEPDVTISDYVADRRAATPSNGAELAVPQQQEIEAMVRSMNVRLMRAMEQTIASKRRRLQAVSESKLLKDPMEVLSLRRMDLDLLQQRLETAGERRLTAELGKVQTLAAKLDALSPLKVLSRGYAIASLEGGRILHSSSDAAPGSRVDLKLADGRVKCLVEETLSE